MLFIHSFKKFSDDGTPGGFEGDVAAGLHIPKSLLPKNPPLR